MALPFNPLIQIQPSFCSKTSDQDLMSDYRSDHLHISDYLLDTCCKLHHAQKQNKRVIEMLNICRVFLLSQLRLTITLSPKGLMILSDK